MRAIKEQELRNDRTKDIEQTVLTGMSVVAQLLRYSSKFTEIKVYYSVQQNTLRTPPPNIMAAQQYICGNTHISSFLFSTPFHIITPNTHP